MEAIVIKLLVIVIALTIWFWSQKLIGAKAAGGGIGDVLHRWTAGWHQWFLKHPKHADRALILSSLGVDVLGVSLVALAVFGSTFAPFVAIIIVFSLRQLTQMVCTLPPPEGMIWRDPGVPSLLVTYGVSNDLFFSGHTALAVLGAIEIAQCAPWYLAVPAVLLAVGEVVLVIVLRAHYTMDVIAGIFAAWFAADLADRCAPWVDAWLA